VSQMPPPGPPPQPAQPQQPPAQQPVGWLNLTLQGSVMTSSMITPMVKINGYLVKASYGPNVIPVYAGPTRVDIEAQWLKTYGQASLETVVPEGHTVNVFYAAPMHQFARGNIGYEKQKRPGVAAFLAIIAAVLVVVLGVVVLTSL
jgi:hypothetical protein